MSINGRRQLLRRSLATAAATVVGGILGVFRPSGAIAAEAAPAQQPGAGSSLASLETLLVEREIHRLMSLYSRACDERRWELADLIFAPNVESSFNPGKGR